MDLFDSARVGEAAAALERLARKALVAYGLEDTRLDVVTHAEHSLFRTFDRETKTAHAVRIYPRGWDRARILRSLFWLTSLRREARVLVPEPILTRSGELIQSLSTPGVSGFRQVALVGWLEGQVLALSEWSFEHANRLGRGIAELHRHAETFELPSDLSPNRRDAGSLREEIDPTKLARAVSPGDEDLFARAVEAACDVMSDAGTGPEVAGLIHANLIPRHVLFGKDDARPIGFSHVRWGYYAYDLATVELAVRSLENAPDLVRGLLASYGEVRPLPAGEGLTSFAALRLLDELVAAAATAEGANSVSTTRRLVERLRTILA